MSLLEQAKKNTGLTVAGLADFLGVSKKTPYNWEREDNWPSWALRKCGLIKKSKSFCSCQPRATLGTIPEVGSPEANSSLIGAPKCCKYCGLIKKVGSK